MEQSKAILNKLLLRSGKSSRMWLAIIALCIGTTLLLLSVLTWWNFRHLLNDDRSDSNSGAVYMLISRQVTERTMGNSSANTFSKEDIDDVLRAPQVLDAGALTPAHFPAYASIGGQLAVATDLPLAAVPDRFLEDVPDDWGWRPGQSKLPVILSSQFLDVYNYVFAPGQGLPQLSRASVKTVGIQLQVGGRSGLVLTAHITGFTDRVSSVLVPESFVEYGNSHYAPGGATQNPSQVILKVKDPSDEAFVSYLQDHNYVTNPQSLQWSRLRTIVASVSGVTGAIAVMLVLISMLVFMFFIELTVAKAQPSIRLLLQLGYSPRQLSRFLSRRFVPIVATTVLVSLVVTMGTQAIVHILAPQLNIPFLPGWPVIGTFLATTLVLLQAIRGAVSRALRL